MRRIRFVLSVFGLAGLSVAAFATSGGAGLMEEPLVGAPLTINKAVSGTAPAGTTFTVAVECEEPTIYDGDATGLTSATITFDASGNPTSENVIEFIEENVCTVTETATGGATTVAYACRGDIPSEDMIPEAPEDEVFSSGLEDPTDPCASVTTSGVEVLIESADQNATVTVTNTFATALQPIAQAVVGRPAFTG